MSKRFTLEEIKEGMEEQWGFCTACGAMHEGCEPDARQRPCDECGRNKVYGSEELIIMGLVD